MKLEHTVDLNAPRDSVDTVWFWVPVCFVFTVESQRILAQVYILQDRHQLAEHLPFCESVILVVSETKFFE